MTLKNIKTETFEQFESVVQTAVNKYGHFVQVVNGGLSYTVGLALTQGYELFMSTHNNSWTSFDAMVLNSTIQEKPPAHHAVYTASNFTVTVDGKEEPSRYGFIEINDPALIQALIENACYGWKTFHLDTEGGKVTAASRLQKVYWGVASDENNKLPWEPGYSFAPQTVESLWVYLAAQENIFEKAPSV